jgi:putative flippase GtrA
MSRKKEFVIFVILSIIGLGVNEIILLVCSGIYISSEALSGLVGDTLWFAISKIIATAIVMVYNFISRKIFLEKKD